MNSIPQELNLDIRHVLAYLMEKRELDFSGYPPSMLERRVEIRLKALKFKNLSAYYSYLTRNNDEIDELLDVITINVSRFFRDTLTFELLTDRILPAIIRRKTIKGDSSLRVWSAGCANGEEPYSVAIIVQEIIKKENLHIDQHIFATDIDQKSLSKAAKALYSSRSIKNIKYKLLKKYFTQENQSFQLIPEIKEKVFFSRYDMLNKKNCVPPDSVYGDFDLILCRNILIYFNAEYREVIFKKLYHGLSDEAYLVLGMAEKPPAGYDSHLRKTYEFCPIFQAR